MDVDTADIEVSAAETSKGRPKIRCFFCDNEGHMKKDCRKFKALQEKGGSPLPQKAKTRVATVEEAKEEKEIPPAYNPDSLMVHINNMKKPGKHSELGHSNYPNQSPSTMWMEWKTSKEKSLNTVGSKSRRGTKNTECDSSLLA